MNPLPAENALAALPAELAAAGIRADAIVPLVLAADRWRFRVTIGDRQFDARYDHRGGLHCEECTPGRERAFTSPDMPPNLRDPANLRAEAVRRIRYALEHPAYEVAQPPVI
jgi:hypothetical protein